jgi:hypothetical protein
MEKFIVMEHKLINTGDYLIIVDESEIKEGDWMYSISNTLCNTRKNTWNRFVWVE